MFTSSKVRISNCSWNTLFEFERYQRSTYTSSQSARMCSLASGGCNELTTPFQCSAIDTTDARGASLKFRAVLGEGSTIEFVRA
jgi:hypothetical protein